MPGVPHIKKLMRQTIKQAQVGKQASLNNQAQPLMTSS